MSAPKKITDDQIRQCQATGATNAQMARQLNVSEAAVSKRVSKMVKQSAGAVPLVVKEANATVWNVKQALQANYEACHALLQREGQDPLKVHNQILLHIKLACHVLQAMYSIEAVLAFQEEVLTVLEECSPGVRQIILERLRERRTVRNAFL